MLRANIYCVLPYMHTHASETGTLLSITIKNVGTNLPVIICDALFQLLS